MLHVLQAAREAPGFTLIPVLIRIIDLNHRLKRPESRAVFDQSWNWIDAYLKLEHPRKLYCFLRQAMMARRTLILLDGLDEGGISREQIERHVAEVLTAQGHVILCTSRPAGVSRTS